MRVPAIDTGKVLEKKATDQIKDFFKAKNSCLLTPYCYKLIGTFGEENAFRPCDQETQDLLRKQLRVNEILERKVIP